MKNLLGCLIAATISLLLGSAGCLAAEVDYGLKVGEKAPDFKLKDQKGEEVSLTALLKKSEVAVVFHRSADW